MPELSSAAFLRAGTVVVTANGKLLKNLKGTPYASSAHSLADGGSLIPGVG